MNKWYSFLVSTKEVKITKPLRWEKHFFSISILSTILFAVWWNQEWSVLLATTFSLKYQLSSFVHFLSFCVCSKPNSPWRQNDDFSRSSCFSIKGSNFQVCEAVMLMTVIAIFSTRQKSVMLSLLSRVNQLFCPSVVVTVSSHSCLPPFKPCIQLDDLSCFCNWYRSLQ